MEIQNECDSVQENIDMPDDFDEREKEREARILEMERLKVILSFLLLPSLPLQ